MRIAAPLFVAVMLVAGCAEPEPPAPEPASSASTSTGPPPSGNGTLSSSPPAPAPVETQVAYDRSGTTWTTVCVGVMPAVQCQHLQEGTDFTEFLPEGDTILRFQGGLTWSEGNDRMGIGIVYEEDGAIVASPDDYAEGVSPLAIDFDLADLAGKRIGYHVASYVSAGVPQAHVDASPGQDWQLQGSLTVLRAAAA